MYYHQVNAKTEYQKQQEAAVRRVTKALRSGLLVRGEFCELCGDDGKHSAIVGHHYAGYQDDNALKLWWICQVCNANLRGPEYHNGSVSKEEARAIVLARRGW